jgi:di/tricarboxylate transporter
MMTLIATAPNLVVNGELISAGHQGLGFFSFSLIGLVILGVAVIYVLVFARHLLPGKEGEAPTARRRSTISELWVAFRVDDIADAFEIAPESPLAGLQLGESTLDEDYGIRVLARVRRDARGREVISEASAGMEFKPGDVLVLAGGPEQMERVFAEQKLRRFAAFERNVERWTWEIGMVPVLIHPDSSLIGRSVTESSFRNRYGLQVIGLRRGGTSIGDFKHSKLAAGDALLLHGPWSKIEALSDENHDFVVMEMPHEHGEVVAAYEKAPVALAILGTMVLLSALNLLPLVVCVLGAAIAAVTTGCLSAERAYRSIRWSSLVLVAGMMPLADALQQTGGSAFIVEGLLDAFGDAGPTVMLAVIFALTASLSLVLSNTAAAVLVAPIAITAAGTMQVSPYPFAIAVLIAASAAYSTPVSSPVVTLVVEPGRYAFLDFMKVGVPLLVLTCLATVLITPLLFPF